MNQEAIIYKKVVSVAKIEDNTILVLFKNDGPIQKFELQGTDIIEDGEKVGRLYPIGTDVESILLDMKNRE